MSSSQPTRLATRHADPTLSSATTHIRSPAASISPSASRHKEYEASIPLADSFIEGELNRESFVSPWAVVSLRTTHIDRAVAQVSTAVTDRATQQMAAYAGYHPTE